MKLTDVLERILTLGESASAPPNSEYTLNVEVVFQDPLTHGCATQVCVGARRLIGDECVQSNWWPIGRLSNPEALAEAVRAACWADVIVVSVNDTDQLPLQLYAWIDAWLPRRQAPASALVSLIGVPDKVSPQAFRPRDYLQAVARRGDLDFLPREQPVPGEAPRFHAECLSERTNTTTHVLREIIDEGRTALRHWGINE